MKARLAFSAAGSIVNRGSAALVLFIGLRQASLSLDGPSATIYVVATYVPALCLLFDLGASFALISPMTRASTRADAALVRQLIRVALRRMGAGLALGTLALLLGCIYLFRTGGGPAAVPWADVLMLGIAVLALTTANLLIASLSQAFFVFHQYSLLTSLGNGLSIALLLGGISGHGSQSWLTLVAATILPAQLMGLLAVIPLRRHVGEFADGRVLPAGPGQESGHVAEIAEFRSAAGMFLILQAAGVVFGAVDPFLLKFFSHPDAATALGVSMRIAQIMSTPFLLVANQLWPIYARLIANRDRRLLRYILFLSCAAGVAIAIACAVGLNLFGREMLQVLTPNFSAKYPGAWTNALGLGAALLVGANVVLAPLVVFLNGAGLLRPQLTASIAFIAIALPLKAWFAYQGSPAMMLTTTALLFVGLNLLSVFWLHGAKFRETVRML